MKDLQSQIERREKQNIQLNDDIVRSREKIQSLLANIDELQSSDSASQLAARRAERELREEKEKALRLERELEGWKGLRVERGSAFAGPAGRLGSERGGGRKVSNSVDLPQRKVSNSKGFL